MLIGKYVWDQFLVSSVWCIYMPQQRSSVSLGGPFYEGPRPGDTGPPPALSRCTCHWLLLTLLIFTITYNEKSNEVRSNTLVDLWKAAKMQNTNWLIKVIFAFGQPLTHNKSTFWKDRVIKRDCCVDIEKSQSLNNLSNPALNTDIELKLHSEFLQTQFAEVATMFTWHLSQGERSVQHHLLYYARSINYNVSVCYCPEYLELCFSNSKMNLS